jgi:hypothetical protein
MSGGNAASRSVLRTVRAVRYWFAAIYCSIQNKFYNNAENISTTTLCSIVLYTAGLKPRLDNGSRPGTYKCV